ncbi:hypothetical protein A3J33_01025 [candidate division WWE3 bacterium RIFCSPLOWO2_02_FULL_53_10]|uniref:PseI/NeuA/B-like domain-containing protein n=1 Tax=candidate division WWE3 bacterium RIFCSPLOWO2_02_FULL_53_10 TaxID=1802629 RepID=A0A1F4W5E3_UNCKA|nr:MAG: hypothetical protein A3J33_01025 [candidate division WWE3 bacterium RIFCSPLOWO2_02_FULL_53_10]
MNSVFFAAELGSLHKGIEALAYEMVRQAKLAGADAAKFQFGWPRGAGPIRCWATDNAAIIRKWCDYFNIGFMASVFSWEGLATAESSGVDYIKMAHPETFAKNANGEDYDRLLKLCFASNKPVFVSGNVVPGATCLYCIPKYPVYQHALNLPGDFGFWNGYSSHTPGIEDALVAIARGARAIEKHVTLNKADESIKDNHFALSFEEFAEMVRIGKAMARLC